MTTQTCNCCFRELDLSQFPRRANGAIRKDCKQCGAKRCAESRRRAAEPRQWPADPMNLALRSWRGPVTLGALLWTP